MPDGYCYFNERATFDHMIEVYSRSLAEAQAILGTYGKLPVGFILVAHDGQGEPIARASVANMPGSKKGKDIRRELASATRQLLEMLDESLALEDG